MKTKWLLLLPAVLSFSLFASAAADAQCDKSEEVTLDQCPEAVQKTIKAEAGDGKITEVEKKSCGETVCYEAEIEKDGKEFEVRVAADGTLLKKKDEGGKKDDKKEGKDEKVTLDQCPEAVQKTIKAQAEGGTIVEIEKETEGDKATYEAEIEKDGKEFEIKVAADGTLLKKKTECGKDDDKKDDKGEKK